MPSEIQKRAAELKKGWMELPENFFQTRCFGDIEIGRKFIVLPEPRDPAGFSSFMDVHRLYIKTADSTKDKEDWGKAININNGKIAKCPKDLPVLLIE